MPDITASVVASQPWSWCSKMLWSVVAMFVFGSMARTFISKEPFDPRKFTGEMILACIGAILIYAMGLMEGMSEIQIICFGATASLGGVRIVEWGLKIAGKVNKAGILGE